MKSIAYLLISLTVHAHAHTHTHTQEGIQPMWEDARNRAGGRWLVNLEKRDRRESLDNCWLETVRNVDFYQPGMCFMHLGCPKIALCFLCLFVCLCFCACTLIRGRYRRGGMGGGGGGGAGAPPPPPPGSRRTVHDLSDSPFPD